jgi:hypothetical protein
MYIKFLELMKKKQESIELKTKFVGMEENKTQN